MSQPPYFVGVDVGGQSIKGGVVDDAGRALSAVSLPTEPECGQEHGLETICEVARLAVAEARLDLDDIVAIGIGTPGTMDIPAGVMLEPPNLKPWKNVPVRKHVENAFHKPTAFQNDANAAAYGEFWVGAGRNARSMVLFTLGTGLGCGIIIDDAIIEGQHSHAAEVGHTIVEASGGRRCSCGQRGHLEAYTGATGIVALAGEALAAAPAGSSPLHVLVRTPGRELTAKDVFDAADAGDPLAGRIVEQTAYYLAVGAVNMMHTLDPDMIVYAGGMTAAGPGLLERIRHHIRSLAFPVPAAKTEVVYAMLGADAGFIGAAGCGRQLWKRLRG